MVTILSFSGRANGNCSQIARVIKDTVSFANIYSFADFQIQPCGRCEHECFQTREKCPYFSDMEYRLLDAICNSDMVYFVLPNYCDYPCANFFVFNERSQCYFQGREDLLERYLNVPEKFIVISNSRSANFSEAFTQHTSQEPEILFISAKAFGKRSIDGDLMDSAAARETLEAFLHDKR